MDLLDTLKQFKRIEPDLSFAENSRRAILASAPFEKFSVRKIFTRVFETAGSLVLAGVLVFAIAGGFSGSKYLSPVSFSGIDPAALHAEAQAIDMQINLANITYAEVDRVAVSTPQAMSAKATPQFAPNSIASSTQSTSTVMTATSTSTSTSMGVNEALEKLAE